MVGTSSYDPKSNFDTSIYYNNIKGGNPLNREGMVALGKGLTKHEGTTIKTIFEKFVGLFSQKRQEKFAIKRAENFLARAKAEAASKELNSTSDEINRITSAVSSTRVFKKEGAKIKPSPREGVKTPPKGSASTFYRNEGASAASRLHLMTAMFEVRNAPDQARTSLYKEKQAFLAKYTEQSNVQLLFTQNKKFPVMQAAIRELREAYESWDTLQNPADIQELKEKLDLQHERLNELSNYVDEFGEGTKEILRELVPEEDLKGKLSSFLNGKISLGDLYSDFNTEYQSTLTRVEEAQANNAELIQKHRRQPVVTNKAIEMQSNLFEAARKGKAWAREQTSINPQGDSANQVFKLKNPKPDKNMPEVMAYYKEGAGGEKAAGVMEKLMWDIAVIMGLEEQFTPTKETEMRTKNQERSGNQTARVWDAEGNLQKIESADTSRQGGIQVAQEGLRLGDHIDDAKNRRVNGLPPSVTISRDQVMKGTMATLVFGMFDAHASNILVDKEGNLKFFDNTRSLPHSNGWINWSGELISSYRSGLLELKESHEPLSPEELKNLRAELGKYQAKLEALERFMANPQTQKQLDKLPPGWLNNKEMLTALKGRLENMQKALDSGQVKTLQDLVFATMPQFKLMAALHILAMGGLNPSLTPQKRQDYLQRVLGEVGFDSLQKLINTCVEKGIDVDLVSKAINSPGRSFNDLLDPQLYRNKSKTKEELVRNGNKLLESAQAEARVDLKDVNRQQIERTISLTTLKTKTEMKKVGIEYLASTSEEDNRRHMNSVPPLTTIVFASSTKPPVITLYQKGLDNKVKSYKLDFTSSPGQVKLEGMNRSLEPKSLASMFSAPTFYHPSLTIGNALQRLGVVKEPSFLLSSGFRPEDSLAITYFQINNDGTRRVKNEYIEIVNSNQIRVPNAAGKPVVISFNDLESFMKREFNVAPLPVPRT